MNRHANTPLATSFIASRPSSSVFAVTEQLRQSPRPIPKKKVRFIAPDYHPVFGRYIEPCNPATLKGKSVEHVAGLKGNRAAVATNNVDVKRFRITVKDKITGLPVDVHAKLEMRSVDVLCYGTAFHFRMKAGSQGAIDSRTGKRVALLLVRKELNRMLGDIEGEAKFAEFVRK